MRRGQIHGPSQSFDAVHEEEQGRYSIGFWSGRVATFVVKQEKAKLDEEKSDEDCWKNYFASPLDWWANRRGKQNPKAPDFKHNEEGFMDRWLVYTRVDEG